MTGPTPPAPVEVTNPNPIDVKVTNPDPISVADTTAQTTARSTAAKATVEADILATEGQRGINRLWERTQAIIALSVVAVTIFVAGYKAVLDAMNDPERGIAAGPGFLFLVAASNLVIGFYFGRTNHTKVGGVSSVRGE